MSTELYSRLKIKKELGEGSTCIVYLAEDTKTERFVALKILKEEFNDNFYVRDMFLQKASQLIEFRHTNSVATLGYGKLPDNRLYSVQELARGESLEVVLSKRNSLPLAEACDIIEQVLACLQSAHEQEIIHRDIIPDNILIEQREHSSRPGVKVIDFGVAQSRRNGHDGQVMPICVGTPSYVAPEIVMDDTLFDHRIDLYSVGVLLYRMLQGQLPAHHDDIATLFGLKISKAWEKSPEWQSIPDPLKNFFSIALAPLAKDRFFDAASMLGELYEIRHKLSSDKEYVKPLALPEW